MMSGVFSPPQIPARLRHRVCSRLSGFAPSIQSDPVYSGCFYVSIQAGHIYPGWSHLSNLVSSLSSLVSSFQWFCLAAGSVNSIRSGPVYPVLFRLSRLLPSIRADPVSPGWSCLSSWSHSARLIRSFRTYPVWSRLSCLVPPIRSDPISPEGPIYSGLVPNNPFGPVYPAPVYMVWSRLSGLILSRFPAGAVYPGCSRLSRLVVYPGYSSLSILTPSVRFGPFYPVGSHLSELIP
jgi:hypothetical protein